MAIRARSIHPGGGGGRVPKVAKWAVATCCCFLLCLIVLSYIPLGSGNLSAQPVERPLADALNHTRNAGAETAGSPVSTTRPVERTRPARPPKPVDDRPSAPPVKAEAVDDQVLGDMPTLEEFLDPKLSALRADEVRAEIQYGWDKYVEYAWGYDELNPLMKAGKNWIGSGMGATILDSLDTLWIAGLTQEYKMGRDWVAQFDFDSVDNTVSMFETTIRSLGGLLSCYGLTGDRMFLDKARDLGQRLLRAFDGGDFPYAAVRIAGAREGQYPPYAGGRCVLSEVATIQMEFFYLAQQLDDPELSRQVARIIDILDSKKQPENLWPVYVAANSVPDAGRSTLGALGDSFYEYLLKVWLQTDRKAGKYRRMYVDAVDAIASHMIGRTASGLTYFAELSDTRTKGKVHKMDHLACFGAGMLALGAARKVHVEDAKNVRDMELAEAILNSCHEGYVRMGAKIGPEIMEFHPDVAGNPNAELTASPGARHYLLRPETVESYFVLWRLTKNPKYRLWGWEAFSAIRAACKTPSGYAGLRDVTVQNRAQLVHDDTQQSFFFAETLKYLYLLFADSDEISLDDYVLNTEAHPLPIWKNSSLPSILKFVPNSDE